MAARSRPVLATVLLAGLLALPASPASAALQRTHGPDPRPAGGGARVASLPPADARSWCARDAGDGTARRVDNGPYRYRAVYAHPADAPSRLGSVGAHLQADAFTASALLEERYGRAIRYDIGTPCGRGQLHIAELRLPFTRGELETIGATGPTATFDTMVRALRDAGYPVAAGNESPEELAALADNFLLWLDAPGPNGSCGQGTALLDTSRSQTNVNNLGGKLALVFRNGNGFCGAEVVRHEIGHNLGALQPHAPNTSDGLHCNDARQDTMCVPSSPLIGAAPELGFFDYGNDDYWDPPAGPPLPWWTVNLSRFLCHDRNCNRPAGAAESESTRAAGAAKRWRPRLQRRLSRGKRYTRLRLRARGRGTARLTVRCRGTGSVLTRRRIAVPKTIRMKTRCRAPRAQLSRRRTA